MYILLYRMSDRKSNRKVTPKNRYGTKGDDASTVAGSSNTTAAGSRTNTTTAKHKGKKAKKVVYNSSSESSESSETTNSSDNSRGNVHQSRSVNKGSKKKRKKSYTQQRTYSSKCPSWDGDKSNWTQFAEQFCLFLRELNKSWDIYTTEFTEDEDTDIYNFLLRASSNSAKPQHKICYKILFPNTKKGTGWLQSTREILHWL